MTWRMDYWTLGKHGESLQQNCTFVSLSFFPSPFKTQNNKLCSNYLGTLRFFNWKQQVCFSVTRQKTSNWELWRFQLEQLCNKLLRQSCRKWFRKMLACLWPTTHLHHMDEVGFDHTFLIFSTSQTLPPKYVAQGNHGDVVVTSSVDASEHQRLVEENQVLLIKPGRPSASPVSANKIWIWGMEWI